MVLRSGGKHELDIHLVLWVDAYPFGNEELKERRNTISKMEKPPQARTKTLPMRHIDLGKTNNLRG